MSNHSAYTTLLKDAICYLKEVPHTLLSTKDEWAELYCDRSDYVNFDSARQSQIEAQRSERGRPFPVGKADEEDRSRLRRHIARSGGPCYVAKQPSGSIEEEGLEGPQKGPKNGDFNGRMSFAIASKTFSSAPMTKQDLTEQANIKTFLKKSSSLVLNDAIPDDSAATRTTHAYQEHLGNIDVVVFVCDNDPETLNLVKNLSKSIDTKLAKTKVLSVDRLEREKRWDLFLTNNSFKLLLATRGFVRLKEGMRYYTERPASSERFLNNIPLLILDPPGFYTPKEKMTLWNQLCLRLKYTE